MKLNTNPLKGKYPITVRIAGLCGIFSLVLIFLVFPRFVTESEFGTVDQIVIENFHSKKIPLCGVLGGGYNKSFDKLIQLHSMLHKNCATYF